MIAWMVFTVICFLIAQWVGKRIEKRAMQYPQESAWRFNWIRLAGMAIVAISVGIPLATPIVIEFPAVFRPTVVTFTESGDLVYHKWGLWTPPWKGIELANVPTDCERLTMYFNNTSSLFEHEGKIYQLEFDGEVCVEDLKKFYSDRSRRRQNLGRSLGKLERSVRKSVLMVHTQNEDEIKKQAIASYCFAGNNQHRAPCQSVTDFIIEKSGVGRLLADNGLRLKHTTEVGLTGLID